MPDKNLPPPNLFGKTKEERGVNPTTGRPFDCDNYDLPEAITDRYEIGETVYENALADAGDVADFRLEGDAKVTFPEARMRLENVVDPSEGDLANFVFWGDAELPDNVCIRWDFYPIREPGLAILFFSARGHGGKDVLDPSLKERHGAYPEYHSSDLNAFHVAYFRRKHPPERAFHTCNLRKSSGFHLVAQAADPLPDVADGFPPYRLTLLKSGAEVCFAMNALPLFQWRDDGSRGDVLGGGRFAFRQMAPLVAEYANLEVRRVQPRL